MHGLSDTGVNEWIADYVFSIFKKQICICFSLIKQIELLIIHSKKWLKSQLVWNLVKCR